MSNVSVDPVTLEVLRHRLWMINDEQGRVASQLSGSPIVYEAKDFNSSLLTAEGDSLFIGIYMTRLSLCLNHVVKNVIASFKDTIGFADGDAFITNDPWTGAAHMNDFIMVAPVFWEGTLVCWTGLAMHEVDVGGPNPGSFTIGTRDVYGEGPLIPPLKMVERGVIRPDIEALVIRNSRTSRLNGLNMRARVAAINRTRQRIREVIDEYGLPTLMQTQRRILELVGASLARRLRSLPDGTWTNEGFIDHDGNENRLYRIRLRMTKSGERLEFDFTGTDRQARGAINCARVGLESGILSAVLPMLCYDLPWSPGGIMPLIDIVSEEGTVNNARHPAGVSMATVSAIFATSHVTSGAIGKMLACSHLKEEAQANWAPAWQGTTLAGHHRGGRPFTAVLLDETGGAGARHWKDGVDTGGLPGTPAMAIANVETYEREHPILYVYRRQSPDTGGAGRYRGGVGTEGMIIPHGNDGPIDLTVLTHGASQPEAQGLYGGYPGSVQVRLLLHGSDVREQFARRRIPTTVADTGSERVEPLAAKQRTVFEAGDALVLVCAGGGGYGDPLQRDPAQVARDVTAGLVSADVANGVYGVALSRNGAGFEADAAGTAGLRREMVARRLREGRPVASPRPATSKSAGPVGTPLHQVGAALDVVARESDVRFHCQSCGEMIAEATRDPKTGTLRREIAMDVLSAWNRFGLTSDIAIREYCCPACAHLIAVEVRRKEDPVLYDTELKLSPRPRG
ncbi:MAG TPA: hydantoinase B/oxoprolinase family protein [Xanthobacteraceae bacterium]|jgi:N-methylhydantoinase B